jgi:hypothetical protein
MLDRMKDLLDPGIGSHKIFFFHIAKCGGTSIANAIIKGYKPWRPRNTSSVVILNEEAARFAERNTIGTHTYPLVRRDLLNYMMSLPNIRCISGHFQYSNSAHDAYPDWHFVTVLRDPVARWLSHYRYNALMKKIALPIEEFIETRQARSFGRAFVDEVTDDLDKEDIDIGELVEIALGRYKRFSLVGRLDDLPDLVHRFEEKFHHKLDIKHLNRTPGGVEDKPLSDSTMARINELCAPDMSLYTRLFQAA